MPSKINAFAACSIPRIAVEMLEMVASGIIGGALLEVPVVQRQTGLATRAQNSNGR